MKKITVVIFLSISIILFVNSSYASNSNDAQDLEFEYEATRCYENTSGKTVGERLYNCGMKLYFRCDSYESQYKCKEGRYYVLMINGEKKDKNIRIRRDLGVLWIWIEHPVEGSKSLPWEEMRNPGEISESTLDYSR